MVTPLVVRVVVLLSAASLSLPLLAEGDIFPSTIEDQIGGKPERLRRTGTALRTKFGVPLYRIAAYCDEDVHMRSVDELASADVPKRLVLVMQRDVADWILQKGFSDALTKNDPDGSFAEQSKQLLEYLSAVNHKEGTAVVLTHIPGVGVECRTHNRKPLTINDIGFARLCWMMFLGPKPVSPEVRAGLGTVLR